MTHPASTGDDSELLARVERALAPAYVVEGELGRGGMAIVYRARDPRLKRGVAVKLLPPDLAFRTDIRTRFLREAETSARLSHPNIVPIYTVDERDGLVYFVMALVEGESVGDRMKRAGAMPIGEARRILREVADALAYAHNHGVVHRDIKPDNILLDGASGRAMVTDFGIARAASEGETRLTATGAAIGTPAYMSPEQCAGDRDIDGRSDLYSLGTVAYQMLAGAPPFAGANTPSIMMKQVTERPAPLRDRRADVPDDLEQIIMRLLEKDPANRFSDGAALVAALDGAPLAPIPRRELPGVPANSPVATTDERFSQDLVAAIRVRTESRILNKLDAAAGRVDSRRARKDARRAAKANRPLPDRIRQFRQQFVSTIGTSLFLVGINYVTGDGFWWCVFPILALGLGLSKAGGKLWAEGVRLGDIFGAGSLAIAPGSAPQLGVATSGPADDLLAGAHGNVVRQAITDRKTVDDLYKRLSTAERKQIPDVQGTADALYERIMALATALHRVDGQIAPGRLSALDDRIAQIEQSSDAGGDRERRLGLLKRQRDVVADLARSRDSLLEQFESAGLLLQNLALDMLKVRSSGLASALDGVTSVTQEARALSREIGYALDAAAELRELESKEK